MAKGPLMLQVRVNQTTGVRIQSYRLWTRSFSTHSTVA